MKKKQNEWEKFATSGKVEDYIQYKNSVSQHAGEHQGEAKNEHKDRRDHNQRTEYR